MEYADGLRADRAALAKAVEKAGLLGKRASRTVGFAAAEMAEQRLVALMERGAGVVIDGIEVPGTTLIPHQSIGLVGDRVLLGRASIVKPGEVPRRNLTRAALSQLNLQHSDQKVLADGFISPLSDRDYVFALLLYCRNFRELDKLHEVALGVLDPATGGFILYQEVDEFLAGYEGVEEFKEPLVARTKEAIRPSLKLRPDIVTFKGGEASGDSQENVRPAASGDGEMNK